MRREKPAKDQHAMYISIHDVISVTLEPSDCPEKPWRSLTIRHREFSPENGEKFVTGSEITLFCADNETIMFNRVFDDQIELIEA